MDISNTTPTGLQNRLLECWKKSFHLDSENSRLLEDEYPGVGTQQIITYAEDVLVRADVVIALRIMISSLIFSLVYIGFVYLCVALTILSVQQLSDSNKYKFRYRLLHKLGLKKSDVDKVILKQLFYYYLCPIFTAVLISAALIIFISNIFVHYTGVSTFFLLYFGISIGVLFGIYIIYFIATYVLFLRNMA
jgi:hypothetical protein